MSQPSLPTRNSGLRVFSASLLSALLIMMPFVQLAAASRRSERGSSPTVREGVGVSDVNSATTPFAPLPKPAPEAPALLAPSITATLDDGVAAGFFKRPGETITYTATISNGGPDPATGVTFTNDLTGNANLTLVPGSVETQPIALGDSFNVLGNVRIQVPDGASDLLNNDTDPDQGNNSLLTITTLAGDSSAPFDGTSVRGGNVTAASGDGSFQYNPPVGYEGADSFTYTVTDNTGKTDTATVNITITGMVWFINNAATACTTISTVAGCGRLTNPLSTLASFESENGNNVDTNGADVIDPEAGDHIFIYTGNSPGTPYSGSLTLENTQRVVGQGASDTVVNITGVTLPTHSDALPATGGTRPTITTVAIAHGIVLANTNTIRGVTVGQTGGTKLIGNNFGTLTIGNTTTPDVELINFGPIITLTNGTFAATSALIGVSTTGAPAHGISLDQVGGTVSLGSTTISGHTTHGIVVTGSTVNVNFGNTSVTGTGATQTGVFLSNNSAGTRTFGTLSISSGSGNGFHHLDPDGAVVTQTGGGSVSVTGTMTVTNPAGHGINIENSNANLTFAATTVNKGSSSNNGVNLNSNAARTITFSSLAVTTTTGFALFADNSGTVNVTNAAGSSLTQNGAGGGAASLTNTALGLNFTSVSSTSGGNGLIFSGGSGTFASGTTNLQSNAGVGLLMSSSSVVANFGNTTVNSSAGDAVDISGQTGNVTFADLDLTPDATLRGLDVSTTTATINSTSGTIVTSDAVAINIVGPGGLTPLNMVLTSVSTDNSGDADSCVSLTNVSGTLNMQGGALVGGTGSAFAVSGGSANITFAGTVTQNSAARVVDIQGTTAGTVSFTDTSTAVTGGASSQGVHIGDTTAVNGNVTFAELNLGTSGSRMTNQAVTITNGPTGATYSLGAVSIFTTGAAQGIAATNFDGTLNSTSGTVDASGAPAININGPAGLTNLGMTLTTVNATGGANGISIQDTSGSFNLAGTATGTDRCGGLVTVNAVGTPATVTAPVTAECTGGLIQTTTAAGVLINNASNISLNRLRILNPATDGLDINTINGFTLNKSLITDSAGAAGDKGVDINFASGTAVNGTISFTSSFIGPTPHDNMGATISSGTSTWNITNVVFDDSQLNSGFNFEVRGSSTVSSFTMDGCVLRNQFADGMQMQPNATATATITVANIQNNTFQDNNLGLDLNHDSTANVTYRVINNTFRTHESHAVNVFSSAVQAPTTGGTYNVRFEGNVIGTAGINDSGSRIGNGLRVNINGGADSTVTIHNNTIRQTPNGRGIEIISRNGTGGLDATVTSNNVDTNFRVTPENAGFSLSSIFVQSNCVPVCNTLRSDVRLNTVPAAAVTGDLLAGQIALIETGASTKQMVDTTAPISGTCASELAATNTGSTAASAGCALIAGPISTVAFNNLLKPNRGFDLAKLDLPRFAVSGAEAAFSQIAELTTSHKPTTQGTVAPAPLSIQSTTLTTSAGANIALAAKSHAQTEESRVSTEANQVRSHHATTEKAPVRTEASALQAHHATASNATRNTNVRVAAPVAGSFTVNIGTLAAGDSVTITFQVTIAATLTPAAANSVSNQATVTGGNFGAVNTDDPQTVAVGDATVTPIDKFEPAIDITTSDNNVDQGDSVTFTATLTHGTALVDPLPTGTIDFVDQGNAEVLCNDVVLTVGALSSTAQCVTTDVDAGVRTIAAEYSGDGRYDTATDTVSQTVVACAQNPVVTNTNDSGAGSLRDAITNVCAAPNNNITFNIPIADPGFVGGVYTITLLTELAIAKDVKITGPNSVTNTNPIVVSGNNVTRVFHLNPGKAATIKNLTIANGNANGAAASHPDNSGGGIFNEGDLTLINSTVSGNVATSFGGGIYSWASVGTATLQVVNSTITGNQTTDGASTGGGVMINSATATLLNSTLSANTSVSGGGGIMVNFGTTTITNCTIVDNTATTGGGGVRADVSVNLRNTIVANSTAPDDIAGSFDTTNGFNLIEDPGAVVIAANNITAQDPVLGPLANNGGATQTHALLPTSPAIEAGSNANLPLDTLDLDGDADTAEALPVDQRGVGYPRTADSADLNTTQTVDIGAFELHPSIEDIADTSTNEDTPKLVVFNLGDDTGTLITGAGGSVTATSSNGAVVTSDLAHLSFTGSGGSRTLTITPNTNASGTTTITITVTATNGRTATDTFDLTVNALNDDPSITNNTGATVNEGSTGNVIDNTKLKVDDADNTAAQITFTVGTAPANGTLRNNGVGLSAGGTFTQADINAGLLTYDHNGSETTSDSFTFTVSDGAGGSISSTAFNITVTAQNDNPVLTNNTGTTVNEGSTGNVIDNTKLQVDDADNTAAQITFTVGTAPVNGTLRNNGVGLSAGGTFTQATINAGLLTYDHDGTETTSDSFSFTVSDGAGGSIGSTTFNITVTLQNDNPTLTNNTGTTVNEGSTGNVIDSTKLKVDDGDNTAAQITYTVGTAPANGTLRNNGVGLSAGGTFTQADIDGNLLTYDHNGSETTSDSFAFTVSDGAGGSIGSTTFNITVTPQNDNPTLTTNAGLSVVNGATGTIDNTKLKVDDADNTAAQITFTVGTTVTNGTLKNGAATLLAGGTFTQADIDGNQITYTHDGTATTSDSFTFTVSDGVGGSIGSTAFNITIGSPNVSINDAQVPEPSSGTIDMTFTVALAAPAGASGASVSFTTNNGSALSGTCPPGGSGDFTATNGTLNFIPGEQVKTINVPICADAVADNGETFTVTLSSPVNATIADGTATGTITANTPGTLLISELRTAGPAGANDDFVEIYNNTNAAIVVPAGGYGLFKKGADCSGTAVLSETAVLVGTIPAGTNIPARGHYLFVGTAYSLANYGGAGAAAGDAGGTLTADIETDANVGLFSTTDVTQISSVNRFDAVGFGLNTGGTCNLLREGATLPAITGNETLEHSYFRKMCDWLQGQGCTVPGVPKDTHNNSADFWLADTTGAAATGRLGAPGPENLGSPIRRDNSNNPGSGGIDMFRLDGTVGTAAAPNRKRDGGAPEGTFGTMTLRHRVVNNTGAPVTRLRYRIVDVSTAIQGPGPTADLRALTSSIESSPADFPQVHDPVTCAAANGGNPATPCNVTVQATTLEQPPTQAIGGGYNSTLSSGTITTGTPLPNGQSILINFKLGVEKTGTFRFFIIIEALN